MVSQTKTLHLASDVKFKAQDGENILNKRLHEQIKKKHIEGEQWFRDFREWLIIVFNNPINYKHPNNELIILKENQSKIFPFIKNHFQIHYGVGVGETENEIVRWQLETGQDVEVCGVDINAEFIELFTQNLKYKQIEYPQQKVYLELLHKTFQEMKQDDFNFINRQFKNTAHICLGGTIGNFKNQNEIFSIFKNNTNPKDILLLGFQLDTHIEQTFEKYQNNIYYPTFVLNYLHHLNEEINYNKISWNLEKDTGFITMNYGDTEAFRTRKYNPENIVNELDLYGFKFLNQWTDEYNASCVAVFEKQ